MKLTILLIAILLVQSIQLAVLPITFLTDVGAILCMFLAVLLAYNTFRK